MKRAAFWLLVTSCTFVLGVAATLISLEFLYTAKPVLEIPAPEIKNELPEIPLLSYCELVNNPEKYHGRIVRFSAVMNIGTENSWFSDARCGADNAAIVSSKNKDVWKTVEKARAGKKNEPWAFRLELLVTGKFENVPFTYCCTKAPFQFEILSVEKASKTD